MLHPFDKRVQSYVVRPVISPENGVSGFSSLCKSNLCASTECPRLEVGDQLLMFHCGDKEEAEREDGCTWLESHRRIAT